jgi:hypothetical protein
VIVKSVTVRSRDVAPSWAGCAKELTEAVAHLVRARRSAFQALVEVTGARNRT